MHFACIVAKASGQYTDSMESFWEKILDFIITALKAFVVLIAIRLLCVLMDIPFPIPFVDDILIEIWIMLTGQVPQFAL